MKVDIFGSSMHYLESGQGDPILFLHGIPTSSYLWRNVIPSLETLGRCIAPDLIGFGKSDKPNIAYSISDHIKYIDKFIETLGLKNLTIVMHGWGSIVGFDYAMRHEKNCRGLVFYEAILRSFHEAELSLPYQEHIHSLVDHSAYIDTFFSQALIQELSDEDIQMYKQPFVGDGNDKPLVQHLKELSVGEDHDKLNQIISRYTKKLIKSKVPKLMLYSIPGFMTTIADVKWAKDNLSNLEVNEVGEELHLAQENCPDLMGELISVWMQSVEQYHV